MTLRFRKSIKMIVFKCLRKWCSVFTVRNEVAKVMFLQVSVCPQGVGVCPSACWDTPPGPKADTPGTKSRPPGTKSRHPPDQKQTSPRDQRQTPPRQTATAVDGTHPTGMHSCSKEQLLRRRWSVKNPWPLHQQLCDTKITVLILESEFPTFV